MRKFRRFFRGKKKEPPDPTVEKTTSTSVSLVDTDLQHNNNGSLSKGVVNRDEGEFAKTPLQIVRKYRMVPAKETDSDLPFNDTEHGESEDTVPAMRSSLLTSNKDKGVPDTFNSMTATHRYSVETIDNPNSQKLGDAYDAVPEIEQNKLPRGGISIETKSVGRIQFGIPPETIKDSMRLGIPVPQIYIVPAERFCREMGPALGVNLAEFEFPAYFNFFVYKKRCTLVVDSQDAQDKICSVFSETLLGPAQFRREQSPIEYNAEDFSEDFPREAIPNFEKELRYFRIMPDESELAVDTLLDFCQFTMPENGETHRGLGILADSGDDGNNAKEGRWFGDLATVYPPDATEEQKKKNTSPRAEIFKLASGLEYIIHDIDENNNIIGRARFNGHIKVSEMMSVEGFSGDDANGEANTKMKMGEDDDSFSSSEFQESPLMPLGPPSFHPPSFGVTTLGNSHGFDKSGSVSGYVLWVNGRGIMIDPPPYSSATLEREGIRPRTIVGIILTHCHADHDAGAFQKVLTGSPVVVITTPTIYKSFIRKYAALASVSPALLRHCHRYKPAIIGEALRFQGANFRFQYSLHSIPCVGFRVDWRGRSIVFTGDHMNKPEALDQLQADGILSKARADDLRNLPLQETDLLLHEAGAPPIHTPLEVLLKLPQRVKKRLYVVHTANIPEGYDLKVAPTGTAGTLRLDKIKNFQNRSVQKRNLRESHIADDELLSASSPWETTNNEYLEGDENKEVVTDNNYYAMTTSFTATNKKQIRHSITGMNNTTVPLVGMRPASSTDPWFILNLLSAVPFMSSLSYASTMEVLETARVEVFAAHERIIEAHRRRQLLCVVWEGTCVEKKYDNELAVIRESLTDPSESEEAVVWHAGDWTGPIALQPDKRLSGESDNSVDYDIVAMSSQGVKLITIEFSSLDLILKNGSALYRKYLDRMTQQQRRLSLEVMSESSSLSQGTRLLHDALKNLNIVDLLDQNFALRKLSAVQKRHMESLAEGPFAFEASDRLWRDGAPVDKAFLIVSGTCSFVRKRRNAGSRGVFASDTNPTGVRRNDENSGSFSEASVDLSEKMMLDVSSVADDYDSDDSEVKVEREQIQLETLFSRSRDGRVKSMTVANDFADLSKNLQKRADLMTSGEFVIEKQRDSYEWEQSQADYSRKQDPTDKRASFIRRASVRARFENKVLGRIHSHEAYDGGLVFSRGHFLGDVSRMFLGHVNTDLHPDYHTSDLPAFDITGTTIQGRVIQGEDNDDNRGHISTLIAGIDGCVVLEFEKKALIPFLDEYPGLLLSLLGTQVVV